MDTGIRPCPSKHSTKSGFHTQPAHWGELWCAVLLLGRRSRVAANLFLRGPSSNSPSRSSTAVTLQERGVWEGLPLKGEPRTQTNGAVLMRAFGPLSSLPGSNRWDPVLDYEGTVRCDAVLKPWRFLAIIVLTYFRR